MQRISRPKALVWHIVVYAIWLQALSPPFLMLA